MNNVPVVGNVSGIKLHCSILGGIFTSILARPFKRSYALVTSRGL